MSKLDILKNEVLELSISGNLPRAEVLFIEARDFLNEYIESDSNKINEYRDILKSYLILANANLQSSKPRGVKEIEEYLYNLIKNIESSKMDEMQKKEFIRQTLTTIKDYTNEISKLNMLYDLKSPIALADYITLYFTATQYDALDIFTREEQESIEKVYSQNLVLESNLGAKKVANVQARLLLSFCPSATASKANSGITEKRNAYFDKKPVSPNAVTFDSLIGTYIARYARGIHIAGSFMKPFSSAEKKLIRKVSPKENIRMSRKTKEEMQ